MLNRITMTGRLVADPELRRTQSGVSVTSFRIANDRDYGKGEEKETDFFDVVAWRSTAEFMCLSASITTGSRHRTLRSLILCPALGRARRRRRALVCARFCMTSIPPLPAVLADGMRCGTKWTIRQI